MKYGVYKVTGKRRYRGHEPGTTFEAILDRAAEQRAIARGDIALIEEVIPSIADLKFTFPEGWLPPERDRVPSTSTGGAVRRLSHLKEARS